MSIRRKFLKWGLVAAFSLMSFNPPPVKRNIEDCYLDPFFSVGETRIMNDSLRLVMNMNTKRFGGIARKTLDLMMHQKDNPIEAEKIASRYAWINFRYAKKRRDKRSEYYSPYINQDTQKLTWRDIGDMLERGETLCLEKAFFEVAMINSHFRHIGKPIRAEFKVLEPLKSATTLPVDKSNKGSPRSHTVAMIIRGGIFDKKDTLIVTGGKAYDLGVYLKTAGYTLSKNPSGIKYQKMW